jgi:hypothetical protein
MHRSGTSACTGVINTLGLPTGSPDAFKPASKANELGFWELSPLIRFNDKLLACLGGAWSSPPSLEEGWEQRADLDPYREPACQLFAQLHPTRQWVWKDPRNSLLLGFWTGVLDVEPVLVICHRNPLEVQASLAEGNGFPKLLSVALWERYTRCALTAAQGRRVLLFGYSDLLADPSGACAHLREFLERHGLECSEASEDKAEGQVRRKLRHATFDDHDVERDGDLSPAQRRLHAMVAELDGAHDSFPAVDLPAETPHNELLFSVRRSSDLRLLRTKQRLARARARETALRAKLDEARNRADKYRKKLQAERSRGHSEQ